MSSWEWGSKLSNLQQVGDFSILGAKSVIFFHIILKIILNVKLGVWGVGQKNNFFVGGGHKI